MKISRCLARLAMLLGWLCLFVPAYAQDSGAFFLLSDASFGTQDVAKVRLEAQDMGAVSEYGGVDVYVYRVAKPLDFLKAQKNLHRIDVEGNYRGPGLANALARIWDNWWNESRYAWRRLFSAHARKAVTDNVAAVKTHPLSAQPTPQSLNPQYKPLKSHQLVDSFRYPIQAAKPIQPPEGVKLAGSSSEFIAAPAGNVMIPLGRLAPGLYVVEAMAGAQRAVTMVFVSDTILVTKVSAAQMLTWTAERRGGKPVKDAQVLWTDGVGVLASGTSDARGVTTFQRSAPEKTYVFGEDRQGGVFVAENFYYDSEIYNTKIYAVTDRPLYRPGETVFVKFIGREFKSARESVPLPAGELKLQVFDPSGFPVAGQTVKVTSETGGDTSFPLPDNAAAGGYDLRFEFKGDTYGAAFRVAEYQKPHFEINVLPAKRDFKTGEAVTGRLQLVYPDGKPVPNARAELSVRAQQLTMIEGDLGYAGQFPVKLTTAELTTDGKGFASFTLPAAREPSRYVLTVLATDGAAYRVRTTRELLIERSADTYVVKGERAFSAAGEEVPFSIKLQPASGTNAAAAANAASPVSWEWTRLEDRKKSTGPLANAQRLALRFAEPGTYTLSLRDGSGNIVGATSHYVSGAGVRAPQGSIDMVFDKASYRPGETARALITFPQPVDEALLTLERDAVEQSSLLSAPLNWVRSKRVSPTQWQAELPVQDNYGPNITLSVVYVKDGEYVFQNLGLRVEQPRIDVAVVADKKVYAPGDKVTLELQATLNGKPVSGTQLTVGVVDEMVYVLQPEIAPNIFDFFYHPRRNNVRTSASLNFIAYDLARAPAKLALPARGQARERAVKVLERPRREDKDTALWQPTLTTDAEGKVKVSFTMPDSLTRWRVTARAATMSGLVGQSASHIRSDKEFYVKWTSPDWMRAQDTPNASVAVFNQSGRDATVELTATGAGVKRTEPLKLKPGANFVSLPLNPKANDPQLSLTLASNGRTVDALAVPLKVVPVHWQASRSLSIPITAMDSPIKLPADAANVRLQFADNATSHFRRIMDDLIDYPYGCVEQTASRLIPYSLALQSALPGEEKLIAQLAQRLNSHRFRLAQMAGPVATFGWWSAPETEGDALLTAYAYYADWHASRALKLALPPGHFDRLLDVYRRTGMPRSHWHRALMLYWMQEMGLPVRSLAEALAEEAAAAQEKAAGVAMQKVAMSPTSSRVLGQEGGDLQAAMSLLLSSYVVQQTQGTLASGARSQLEGAVQKVRQAGMPLTDALLMMTGDRSSADAVKVLESVRSDMPTLDRSLALLWTYRALGGGRGTGENVLKNGAARTQPQAPWQPVDTITGQRVYRWPSGQPLPSVISVASAPSTGTTAIVQFESREPQASTLPVQLKRTLYRLVPGAKVAAAPQGASGARPAADVSGYTLEPVAAGTPLKTDEVYLDEIVLKRNTGPAMRFGIVEVPLPPGASADRTTWGIAVRYPGGQAAEALEQARYEQTPRGYAVPVDTLEGEVRVRHLVRAAQTGRFVMPPARYYGMYQPDQKAFEENPRAYLEVR
ncbi:hypothetical protein EDC30_1024 [Paucimonas lemoignei]|uniref:Alpha-2-macroglobulin family protein n=1 Tax=Paucimonas lemoignei TaxID=29443 RepID=A0A4R3I2Y6_PAULE|nr:alpha-2-macroglobulin [Paucimonas lemoignei]TCS38269.1 hypothetical protein EDC30_1024 [Paucimonas lemoignei]